MWAAHRHRTEGRAGRAHLLLARSLDAVEDTPEGAEVRPGSPGDPDRTSARCCPLLPTLASSPATLYNPRSSSARRSEEEARPLLDLIGPPCRLWAAWASTVEHPAMCRNEIFLPRGALHCAAAKWCGDNACPELPGALWRHAARDNGAGHYTVDQVDDGGHDGHGPEGQIRRVVRSGRAEVLGF